MSYAGFQSMQQVANNRAASTEAKSSILGLQGGTLRNIHEVLKEKEEELQRVTQQLNALRLVARLLSEDGDEDKNSPAAAEPSRGRPMPKVNVFP